MMNAIFLLQITAWRHVIPLNDIYNFFHFFDCPRRHRKHDANVAHGTPFRGRHNWQASGNFPKLLDRLAAESKFLALRIMAHQREKTCLHRNGLRVGSEAAHADL